MQQKKNYAAVFAWCLYDWACSSFSIIVTTFIFATYFTTKVAENSIIGTFQWANATSIAGIVIAVLSPMVGAIADHGGQHKVWLFFCTYISVLFTALLWFAYPDPSFVFFTLFCVVVATITYEVSQVFYNSFLTELTDKKYLGRVSGWGWGSGYLGGIVALTIALFAFIRAPQGWFDTETAAQIRICGPFVALWYGLFALPLFFLVPALSIKKRPLVKAVEIGFKTLIRTLKSLPKERNVLWYLIAHMIYTDGLNTLFAFGGIYAAGTFGLSFEEVLIFGITMNITAGLGAIALGWVDDLIGPKATIYLSLVFLCTLGLPLVLLTSKYWFWSLALALCLFVGPVQSASRSLMVRLIAAKNMSAEMFGLYALSGKITAFIGPWLLGITTFHFASQRAGMATVLLFFVLGSLLLMPVKVERAWNLDDKSKANP